MKLLTDRLKRFLHYQDLVKHLVMKDLKLKYRRSVLGYLWSVLNPLLIMIVMSIVFSQMFDRHIENFPLYLFTGQILFNYMNQSTHIALSSINANAALIKKAYVPKYIFTFAKITSGLVDLIFSLAALIIVMIFTGSKFSFYNLLFPVVLLQLYVFCIGLGLFLAQANVFFRDIQYIYNAITTAWMYLTPIFYTLDALPDLVAKVVTYCNPMYFYISQFRDIIYYNQMMDWRMVIAGCISSMIMLLIGIKTFVAKQHQFIFYV